MQRTLFIYAALAAVILIGPGGCGTNTPPPPPDEMVADIVIPAGTDCWSTECGRTTASFCRTPIPPGFFLPDSFPFFGTIRLQGQAGMQDTQVQRHQDMVLNNIGDTATVPIELVQLDLVNCDPIIIDTGRGPTVWQVHVTLSDFPPAQRLGQMIVTKTHANGGTFVSDLIVQPKFIFNSNSEVRVLDTGDPQRPFPPENLKLLGEAPWVHQLDPGFALTMPPCGSNFVPGVREEPATGTQCCVDVCHQGATTTHCIVVERDCSGCPDGACCMPDGSCTVVSATMGMTAEEVCMAMGGEYKGDGTDCTTDTDMDGIPDVKETNDCCGRKDNCNVGTNACNPDTDGDGVPDGTEVTNGTDPCDPNDF